MRRFAASQRAASETGPDVRGEGAGGEWMAPKAKNADVRKRSHIAVGIVTRRWTDYKGLCIYLKTKENTHIG